MSSYLGRRAAWRALDSDNGPLYLIGAVLVVMVAFIAFGIVIATRQSAAYDQWCQSIGGHVVTSTQTGTGINPANGQPVVTTSTTTYCLTSDGRILDVQ